MHEFFKSGAKKFFLKKQAHLLSTMWVKNAFYKVATRNFLSLLLLLLSTTHSLMFCVIFLSITYALSLSLRVMPHAPSFFKPVQSKKTSSHKQLEL